MSFLGFVTLGNTLKADVLTKNSSLIPTNGDALPSYRIYGPSGLVTGGTGSAALRNTGTVTGASSTTPIVITSASHGLTTGTRVTLSGIGGNTAANGTFTITNLTTNTFSLDSSVFNGTYTSGGTWNVSGLYLVTHAISGSGYESGNTYSILVNYAISGTSYANLDTFTVV